jgi:hypothetical protein
MPEAEVSVRLAFWLIQNQMAAGDVDVAIDGAQVKVGDTVHFDLSGFLQSADWRKRGTDNSKWQDIYQHADYSSKIRIHSSPGKGDVVVPLRTGHTLRVECKKGPTTRSKSSAEYPLIREALGQLLTVQEIGDNDILAVAVPFSPKFDELATRWREATLIRKFGIKILRGRYEITVTFFTISLRPLMPERYFCVTVIV